MSTITRDVVRDLLPLYLSGEASADTTALVQQYLASDWPRPPSCGHGTLSFGVACGCLVSERPPAPLECRVASARAWRAATGYAAGTAGGAWANSAPIAVRACLPRTVMSVRKAN